MTGHFHTEGAHIPMNLFDEMPRIESERLILREFVDADAEALAAFAHDEEVYRYLPTFLYEQRYDDAHLVISRMREECFDTKESILLAICLRDAPDQMLGIAEFYAYEPRKPKASIGYRLGREYWGQGIATEVVGMLKDHLLDRVHMRTITAHVICENVASARALQKNDFVCLYPHVGEDWGWGEPVLIDKWIYKRRWGDLGPSEQELPEAEIAAQADEYQPGSIPILRFTFHDDIDPDTGEVTLSGDEKIRLVIETPNHQYRAEGVSLTVEVPPTYDNPEKDLLDGVSGYTGATDLSIEFFRGRGNST